jgi:hypothetical protein
MGLSGQCHASAALTRKRPHFTHWIGRWVGLRAGLDSEGRGKNSLPVPENEPRSPSLI